MGVFCRYSLQLVSFLKNVVEYVFAIWGNGFYLDNLEEIELVNARTFSYDTDGQTVPGGKKIIPTSRLYAKIPVYDIQQLNKNEKFKLIVNTLYHEMGHVSGMQTMPNIYAAASNLESKLPFDDVETLSNLYFIMIKYYGKTYYHRAVHGRLCRSSLYGTVPKQTKRIYFDRFRTASTAIYNKYSVLKHDSPPRWRHSLHEYRRLRRGAGLPRSNPEPCF